MRLPFVLPPLNPGSPLPQWEGNGFRIDQEWMNVLQYSMNSLGWNDELTEFHEEAAGDQHFIDRASRDYAIGQLRKHLPQKNPIILEVGCSSGFMLRRMQRAFPEAILVGADVVLAPLKKLAAELPTIPLLRFDMVHCPIPDASFNGIVMLNVLEHIDNDATAIQQAYRILKPGGILVIEVPAGPHLYDHYDQLLMHYRRYVLADLAKLMQQQGFVIQKKSHLGFFLYPAFSWIKKRNQHLLNQSAALQRQQVEKSIAKTGSNPVLHMIMQTELLLGKLISYAKGIRCLITCKKQS